uniref:Putative non-inhibitory serpin-10 n=1 Tax=Aegilops tauschii TaxID=37682 RepID=M8BC51_AEGTA
MASRLSPFTRTSAVTKSRQLAPTVRLSLGGVEFLEGALTGIEGYAISRMTKSRRGKLYIDDSGWGPEAGSIEYGYRVPFGKIHVFIGKIGESAPVPDICTDIVEPARRAQPARTQPGRNHVFVGFTQGVDLADNSASSGDTLVYSDGESSVGDIESILPLYDERLWAARVDHEPPRWSAVYMAGTAPTLNSTAAGAVDGTGTSITDPTASGPVKPPAQVPPFWSRLVRRHGRDRQAVQFHLLAPFRTDRARAARHRHQRRDAEPAAGLPGLPGPPPPQRGQCQPRRRDARVVAAHLRRRHLRGQIVLAEAGVVSAATSAHRASVRSVDFQKQPAAAAAEVNALIAETTRGRIRDLVSPDSFRGDPKIVLANAMHFKATWSRRFDRSDTTRSEFHRLDGTSVRAPFLSAPGMQYATSFDDLGFKVLQCFYKMAGRDGKLDPKAPLFSMLIFLPHRRDGLRDLLRLAFSFRFDATDALRGLGLAAPFDPLAADLSGAVSNMPPEGLYVSAVEQMCAVEVDEEGTTAVVAFYSHTSPTYSPFERPPPPPMSFVADHPFLFAIV